MDVKLTCSLCFSDRHTLCSVVKAVSVSIQRIFFRFKKPNKNEKNTFYRMTHSALRGNATVGLSPSVCLSVCPSVRDVDVP